MSSPLHQARTLRFGVDKAANNGDNLQVFDLLNSPPDAVVDGIM